MDRDISIRICEHVYPHYLETTEKQIQFLFISLKFYECLTPVTERNYTELVGLYPTDAGSPLLLLAAGQ